MKTEWQLLAGGTDAGNLRSGSPQHNNPQNSSPQSSGPQSSNPQNSGPQNGTHGGHPQNAAANSQAPPARYIRFGTFQLDLVRQDLLRNGQRLRLPGKVCQTLLVLLERPGDIVTREELRARLWAEDTHVNFDANVNTTVNKLRQILGDSNGESAYVQTIPRKGYSFVGAVEFMHHPITAEPLRGTAGEPAAESVVPPAAESAGANAIAPERAKAWFTAAAVALVIAAMLLGAAITFYSNKPF
jgi:DNA-binding winged helix-turn-helix (wHTH) protein